jgi:hypothetical protein
MLDNSLQASGNTSEKEKRNRTVSSALGEEAKKGHQNNNNANQIVPSNLQTTSRAYKHHNYASPTGEKLYSMNFRMIDPEGRRHTVRTLLTAWMSVMLPCALIAWSQTRSIVVAIGSFFLIPGIGILQGTLAIFSYRQHFGDSPIPNTPTHGVVVVNPADRDPKNKEEVNATSHVGCSCVGGKRWRRGGPLNDDEQAVLDRAMNEPPVRLLVIGDSLAIGVGTSSSCTPILPEVIAKTLSKELGGRAVYWTSHGAPGASAGWVVRELERGVQYLAKPPVQREDSSFPNAMELSDSSSDESSSTDTIDTMSEGSTDDEATDDSRSTNSSSKIEFQEWRSRLHRHRKRFDPEILGPYDIAVVLTGANDVKASSFPFLLKGDQAECYRQAKQRGGAYGAELRRLLDVLSQRMKLSLQESIDRVCETMQESIDRVCETMHLPHPNFMSPAESIQQTSVEPGKTHERATVHESANANNISRPLIVLPGNPASVLPSFQIYPVKWLTVPILAIADNHKRQLAETHPDHVLFVEPPMRATIGEFEDQQGPLWRKRCTEDTLLELRDVRRRECESIASNMKRYYSARGRIYGSGDFQLDESAIVAQHNPPVPKLSERPGPTGSKIFSVDGIHPNDEGYDFWGRYIAEQIVHELKKHDER